MFKKMIMSEVLVIMILGLLAGCSDKFYNDRIEVFIKEDCLEKFDNKSFTLEDFSFDNVKKFDYYCDKAGKDRIEAKVHLKAYLKKQEAIIH